MAEMRSSEASEQARKGLSLRMSGSGQDCETVRPTDLTEIRCSDFLRSSHPSVPTLSVINKAQTVNKHSEVVLIISVIIAFGS